MKKPCNPYRPGSAIWSVFEGDWADLTVGQIAEVLGVRHCTVSGSIKRIRAETGYRVPHVDGRQAGIRKRRGESA